MIGSMILTFTFIIVGIALLVGTICILVSMWKDEEYLLFFLLIFAITSLILTITGYILVIMGI